MEQIEPTFTKEEIKSALTATYNAIDQLMLRELGEDKENWGVMDKALYQASMDYGKMFISLMEMQFTPRSELEDKHGSPKE